MMAWQVSQGFEINLTKLPITAYFPQGTEGFPVQPDSIKKLFTKIHLLRKTKIVRSDSRNKKCSHRTLLPALSLWADPCFFSRFIGGLSWISAVILLWCLGCPCLSWLRLPWPLILFLSPIACDSQKFPLSGQVQLVSCWRQSVFGRKGMTCKRVPLYSTAYSWM